MSLVFGLIVLAFVVWAVLSFNRLVRRRNQVRAGGAVRALNDGVQRFPDLVSATINRNGRSHLTEMTGHALGKHRKSKAPFRLRVKHGPIPCCRLSHPGHAALLFGQVADRGRSVAMPLRWVIPGAIAIARPSAHAGAWVWIRRRAVANVNHAGRARGTDAATLARIGRHFSIFYPPEVAESGWPAEELRLALANGRFEDEGWRLRKDGSRFWASVVITPLFDERGTHRGFAKVTRDLTDKRRISSLEDEGRRITTFLSMLGHELRNPLAPMANALAVMDVAEPESEHVRLAEALAEAMEAAEPLARAKGHSLTLAESDLELWISGDRARIIQVLGNLLGNAIKWRPDQCRPAPQPGPRRAVGQGFRGRHPRAPAEQHLPAVRAG